MADESKRNPLEGDLISRTLGGSGLLDRLLEDQGVESGTRATFPVDIVERDDGYRIIADLPGFAKGEIDIGIDDSILSISARKAGDAEEKDAGRYVRRERPARILARAFHLSRHVDEAGVQANLENGVLDLFLPKSAAAKRKIEIR